MAKRNMLRWGLLCLVTILSPCIVNAAQETQQIIHAVELHSFATAYYPANTPMQGGFKDRLGHPLFTLQDFLRGQAPYVSVAMDVHAFPYGTRISIPEISRYYGRDIVFAVVDTGGAFRGRGTTRIDICTQDLVASHSPAVNGPVTIVTD